MKCRAFYKFIKGILLVVALLVFATVFAALYFVKSPRGAVVELPQGLSAKQVAYRLESAGVIRTPVLFATYLRIVGWSRRIQAGRYDIPKGLTLAQLAEKLVSGDVLTYSFTIVEGWSIKDIIAALEGKDFLGDESVPLRYEKLAHDPAFIQKMGFTGVKSLEGYLFPDTYEFTILSDPAQLIEMQVERFWAVFNSLGGKTALDLNGYSLYDIVTIASLVEKEAKVPEERPLIAAVIYNRLKKGMLLQIDPTVIYGIPNFNGNLTKKDLANPHPYNTYVHPGLPPGPICNPGKDSLAAALRPANVDYLYFVSRKDGTHEFNSTLQGHLRAVMRYQLN